MTLGSTALAGSAVLGSCLALAACQAPAPAHWHKDGVSAVQRRSDRHACARRAGGYDFLRPGGTRSARVGGPRRAELYRWCMTDRGYRRVGPNDTQTRTR